MQIAGSTCKICNRGIVFADEGKFCAECGVVVHLDCECKPVCGVCGRPFQRYERAKPDPALEGMLPPALRAAKSSGPVFAISMTLAVVIWTLLLIVFFSAGW